MRRAVLAALILTAFTLRAAEPAAPEKGSTAEMKKTVAWSFEPDPKLPNVLIIGDSISIGYTLQVRELLKGKANVYRPTTADGKGAENCNGTTYGLTRIDRWIGDTKWAVIHFNFGLHDLKHVKKPGDATMSNDLSDPQQATAEQYGKNLEQIVRKLKATGAKLIFATTTPVPEGAKGRTPDMPPKYNAVALKIMRDNGIEVDDLAALVEPNLEKYQQPKDVHYNAEGYKALAKQAAEIIEKDLK